MDKLTAMGERESTGAVTAVYEECQQLWRTAGDEGEVPTYLFLNALKPALKKFVETNLQVLLRSVIERYDQVGPTVSGGRRDACSLLRLIDESESALTLSSLVHNNLSQNRQLLRDLMTTGERAWKRAKQGGGEGGGEKKVQDKKGEAANVDGGDEVAESKQRSYGNNDKKIGSASSETKRGT
jgi:hypothetical protein